MNTRLAKPTRKILHLFVMLSLTMPTLARSEDASFNRVIRPILSEHCFACHGPDAKARKAGLRLDVREEALKPAKSGVVAIVPGDPKKSELVARITTADEDEVMPPRKAHKRLSNAQIAALRKWVADGAVYQKHWAFEPLVKSSAPRVARGKSFTNPIQERLQLQRPRRGPETGLGLQVEVEHADGAAVLESRVASSERLRSLRNM